MSGRARSCVGSSSTFLFFCQAQNHLSIRSAYPCLVACSMVLRHPGHIDGLMGKVENRMMRLHGWEAVERGNTVAVVGPNNNPLTDFFDSHLCRWCLDAWRSTRFRTVKCLIFLLLPLLVCGISGSLSRARVLGHGSCDDEAARGDGSSCHFGMIQVM
ncbi:hypothetical protein IF2G_09509 [Cordyceps javanica]|nr:hypothetical protein IF2G_09509 [Cordyceps javanica]